MSKFIISGDEIFSLGKFSLYQNYNLTLIFITVKQTRVIDQIQRNIHRIFNF